MVRATLAAIALAAAAGCSTMVQVGANFDLAAFESRVQYGVTTRDQVRAWLGAPKSTGIAVETNGDRFEEWTYYYGQGDLGNMAHTEFKTLQVKFDRGGVVRGYSWSGR